MINLFQLFVIKCLYLQLVLFINLFVLVNFLSNRLISFDVLGIKESMNYLDFVDNVRTVLMGKTHKLRPFSMK